MTDCNEKLKAQGSATYPRTCRKCGLGPCKEKPVSTETYHHNSLKQIAGLIQKLSYRDMLTLGAALAKNSTESSTEGYAEALLKTADDILPGRLPSDA